MNVPAVVAILVDAFVVALVAATTLSVGAQRYGRRMAGRYEEVNLSLSLLDAVSELLDLRRKRSV